jgi:hypothetical protein
MADEHLTNAIIATALLDSFRDHPDHKLDPEEAKIIAKRILAAFADVGPGHAGRSVPIQRQAGFMPVLSYHCGRRRMSARHGHANATRPSHPNRGAPPRSC